MLKSVTVVVVILVLVVVIVVAGFAFALPPTREGRAALDIAAPPQDIVAVIEDVEDQPRWRGQLAGITRTADGWEEQTMGGERIRFRWTFRSGERLELVFESSAGYSGQWMATLAPTRKGTLVSVVEHATIANPFARLIARVFFDPDKFATQYLEELKLRVEGIDGQ